MTPKSASTRRPAKRERKAPRSQGGAKKQVAKTMRPTEICAELGIQPYVLKFWENEFPQLGRRLGAKREYGPKERALVRKIHTLVEEQRLSLADARVALGEAGPETVAPAPAETKAGRRAAPPAQGASSRVIELEARLAQVTSERDRLRRELDARRAAAESGGTSPPAELLEEMDACAAEARELASLAERLLVSLAPTSEDAQRRGASRGAASRKADAPGLFSHES